MVSQSYSLSRESTDSYGKLIRQYMQKLSGRGYYQGEYATKTGDTATVFHRSGEQVWSQRKNMGSSSGSTCRNSVAGKQSTQLRRVHTASSFNTTTHQLRHLSAFPTYMSQRCFCTHLRATLCQSPDSNKVRQSAE